MLSMVYLIIVLFSPMQNRVSKYQKYEHELNLFEFQYLGDTKFFDKFEYQNNISVNVCGYKD